MELILLIQKKQVSESIGHVVKTARDLFLIRRGHTEIHGATTNLVPRVHWLFGQREGASRVSTGALPLTKKPVDSGYEIVQQPVSVSTEIFCARIKFQRLNAILFQHSALLAYFPDNGNTRAMSLLSADIPLRAFSSTSAK